MPERIQGWHVSIKTCFQLYKPVFPVALSLCLTSTSQHGYETRFLIPGEERNGEENI
jgi:hypothetical protein